MRKIIICYAIQRHTLPKVSIMAEITLTTETDVLSEIGQKAVALKYLHFYDLSVITAVESSNSSAA